MDVIEKTDRDPKSRKGSHAVEKYQDDQEAERMALLRKAISNLIRTQRKYRDEYMTQEELAFRSGISYEHLNHIENCRAMASIEVLDRIACSLGFRSLSDFLACDESKLL